MLHRRTWWNQGVNLPFPTGMSMVCSPPDPVPTPSCLSWLAGMVKTVCWELEPPEWIFSIPGEKQNKTHNTFNMKSNLRLDLH